MIPLNGFGNRFAATLLLVVATIAAYVAQASGELSIEAHGLVPTSVANEPWTLVTSMFLHAPSPWHIAGNMLFLWAFGQAVEERLGAFRFVALYLAAGVLGGLGHVAVDPGSTMPMVGASGAVAGIMAAHVALCPQEPCRVLQPIVPLWLFGWVTIKLPAWMMALVFLGMNLAATAWPSVAGDNVAVYCHLAGFAAGFVLGLMWRPARPALVEARAKT